MRPVVRVLIIFGIILFGFTYMTYVLKIFGTDASLACGKNLMCMYISNSWILLNALLGYIGLIWYAWISRKTDPYIDMEKGWAVVKKRNEKIRSAFVLLVFLGFFVFFGPISLMDGSKTPPIAGLGPLTAFIITELFLLFLYRKLVGKDFDNGKSYMGINISNNGIILKNDKETIEVQLDQVVGVLFYIKSRDPNGIPVFAVFNLANGKDLTFDGSSKTPPERADIFNKIKASVSTTKIFTHNF